jgi:type IV pilus assembly protein PilM
VHHADRDRETYLLLDIGHTASHVTLYQRGEPYFCRRLEFGGRNVTEAITRAANVPFEEAEEFKLAAGSDTPGFKVDWELPEMIAIAESLRRELVDDVRRSLAFYRTMGSLPEQMNLWISGGTARLPGLAAQLTEMLGVPVLLFNPLDHLSGDPRRGERPVLGTQYAQAFGLALRAA